MYRIPLLLVTLLCILVVLSHQRLSIGTTGVSLPIRGSIYTENILPTCLANTPAQVLHHTLILPIPKEIGFPVRVEGIPTQELREEQSIYRIPIPKTTEIPEEIILEGQHCRVILPIQVAPNYGFDSLFEQVRSATTPVTYQEFLTELAPYLRAISRSYPVKYQDPCRKQAVIISNPSKRAFRINNGTPIYQDTYRTTTYPLHLQENTEALTLTFCDQSSAILSSNSHVVLYGTNDAHRMYLRKGTLTYTTPGETITPTHFLSTPDLTISDTIGTGSLTYHTSISKSTLTQNNGYTIYQQQGNTHIVRTDHQQDVEISLQRLLTQKGIIPTVLKEKEPSYLLSRADVAAFLYQLLEQTETPHPSYAVLYATKKGLLPEITGNEDFFTNKDLLHIREQLKNLTNI